MPIASGAFERATPRVALQTDGDYLARPALSLEQDRVVRHKDGALLVLGSPGSGKTTVLAEALVERLNGGAAPHQVLAIVSDRTAVRRWRDYLSARAAPLRSSVVTFHGLAVQAVLSAAAESGEEAPRLLTEEDRITVLSEVVANVPAHEWPPMFAAAVGTTAFAARVADFLSRAVEQGWTPDGLAAAADPAVQPLWQLLARVWRGYRDVLDLAGVMDYQDLLLRAARILSHRRNEWQLVVLDDFQELDAVQRQLLHAVLASGSDFIAAGNPDQASNRFRGADPAATADFTAEYSQSGQSAEVVLLSKTYRFGKGVAAAMESVLAGVGMPGLPVRQLRALRAVQPADHDSTADLLIFSNAHDEAARVTQVIRRYGLAVVSRDGAPKWDEIAVVVRTSAEVAAWEQTLLAADIPVLIANSDRSLSVQPTVRVLLSGLTTAASIAGLRSTRTHESDVVELLTSPLGRTTLGSVRDLARHLRARAVADARPLGKVAESADSLLSRAVLDPVLLADIDPDRFPAVLGVGHLHDRLRRSAEVIAHNGSVGEALWQLWSDGGEGSGSWAESLRAAALVDDRAGRVAQADLDAVLALFAQAERTPVRGGEPGVLTFLEQFSGEVAFPTTVETTPRNAVQICTVHRAKGRQWPLVILPGVQEGRWPGHGSALGLLGEDKLARTGAASWQDDLADERRLFVLGCTRAQEHLLIMAVDGGVADPSSDRPSRFCSELGLDAQHVVSQNVEHSLTKAGLIASLRATAVQPEVADTLRIAARRRLASLAGADLFPPANPDTWWAIHDVSVPDAPLWPTHSPLTVSITGLVDLAECPRRWLLDRVLQARPPSNANTSVGLLVHRISQAWAEGEIAPNLQSAHEIADAIWAGLAFAAPWQSRATRQEVTEQIERLLAWHQINASSIAFAERSFIVESDLPEPIRIRGKADLGLVNSSGELALIDLKTSRNKPTQSAVDKHVQLAGYQWAANEGAFLDIAKSSAGAALLFSAIPHSSGSAEPKQLWQEPLASSRDEPGWFEEVLATAATRLRMESFPAIASPGCQHCPFQAICPTKTVHWEDFDGCR